MASIGGDGFFNKSNPFFLRMTDPGWQSWGDLPMWATESVTRIANYSSSEPTLLDDIELKKDKKYLLIVMARGAYPVPLGDEKIPDYDRGGLEISKKSFRWFHKILYDSRYDSDHILQQLEPWEERSFENEE